MSVYPKEYRPDYSAPKPRGRKTFVQNPRGVSPLEQGGHRAGSQLIARQKWLASNANQRSFLRGGTALSGLVLPRLALRFVPYIGFALGAYSLLDFFMSSRSSWNNHGWTEQFRCPDGGNDEGINANMNGTGRCITRGAQTQALWAAGENTLAYTPSGDAAILKYYRNVNLSGSLVRYNSSSQWTQQLDPVYDPSVVAPVRHVPFYFPVTRPLFAQALALAINPSLNMPNSFQPFPAPLPWAAVPHLLPDIAAAPSERSSRGYSLDVFSPVPPIGKLVPLVYPRAALDISPSGAAHPSGGRQPPDKYHERASVSPRSPRWRVGTKEPKFKGRKNREKKARWGKAAGAAYQVVGTVSELFDLVDVLYKGLPSHHRVRYGRTSYFKRNPTIYEKARALGRGFDDPEYDFEAALSAYIENSIEDRFYGEIGKRVAKLNRSLDLPAGLQFGSAQRRYWAEAARREFGITDPVDSPISYVQEKVRPTIKWVRENLEPYK